MRLAGRPLAAAGNPSGWSVIPMGAPAFIIDPSTEERPARFGHVEKKGSSEPALVLVPCLGCDGRSWDEFMARNAFRYRMYAVTWPGMGDNALPDVPADSIGTPLWDRLLAPRENVLRYWAEWLRADAGALVPTLRVPLLAMFALSPQDPDPAKTRRERLARFERAQAPHHVRVEFVEDSGHFIWEFQPEQFDRLVAEFPPERPTPLNGLARSSSNSLDGSTRTRPLAHCG